MKLYDPSVTGSLIITGSVGIGTDTSSGKELTVLGSISASGDIFVDDDVFVGDDIVMEGNTAAVLFRNGTGGTKSSIAYTEDSIRLSISSGNPASIGHLVVTASGGTATENVLVGIGTETPSKMLTVGGDISGSGVVYAASASFGADKTNQWMDGSRGNDEFIALTPADFHVVDSTRGTLNARTTDGGGSIRCQDAGTNYHAMKVVPKGFEAYRGVVYGNSTGDAWTANSGSIVDQGTVSIRSSTSVGTEGDFSPTVISNGENYVVMEWNPTATSDELDGGKIFIRRLS